MTPDKELTLGEFLRQERERRGITIEQVASATKVGVRSLHSLEADQYVELPAKPFIRGFVTSYCRFIGLDPKEILSRYDSFITHKANERPKRDTGHSGYAFEKKDGEQQGRTFLLVGLCSFIVLGGLAIVILKPSLRHHRSSHIDKLRASRHGAFPEVGSSGSPMAEAFASPVPTGTSSTLPSSMVEALPTPTTTASPVIQASPSIGLGQNPADPLDSGLDLKADEIKHKLSLKIQDDIWVRYQVDERPIRKFVVRKGKMLVLKAKNSIRLQISHPDAVTLSYNGRSPELVRDVKTVTVKQGDTTLIFPPELGDQIERPFGDAAPLPKKVEPKSEGTDQKTDLSE